MNDKPINVLLVEDNPGDARLIQEMLAEAGGALFDLGCADRLSTGLERLAVGDINVVLLDLGLPDSRGLDTFVRVRTQAPDVPIVVLTGLDDEALAVQAVEAGAQDYLVKGQVDSNPLARALRYAIERKRAEEALRRSERELSVRNQIAHIFLTIPDEEMYGEVLRVILETTASKYGVFGYIGEDGALVCPSSMTKDVRDQCQIPDKDIVFPHEAWGGIWGRALIEKRSLYLNEPFRVPEGHIPIFRALDVPIVHQGEVIGNLLVGNKATDYDEKDKELLEAIAGYIAPVLAARLQRDRQERERKRAEEALAEERNLLRTVIDNLPDLIYAKDTESRLVIGNIAVARLMGATTPDEVLGKTDFDFYPQELAAQYYADEQRIIRSGQPLVSGEEPRIDQVTGKKGWLSTTKVPLRDSLGKIVGLVGIGRDITERKQLEAQLRQAQKMEAIGQLAAGIAHDFNNLLTPMGGFSELLMRKAPEGSQQHEYLRQIKVAAERAADLTRQLRLFTRQEKGERHPIQLNSVVEETCNLLERSIPKEITIELCLESELWTMEADRSQISQVLINLCVNACDAMPDGGTFILETRNVTLDEEYARTVLEARPGRYVCFSVSDTGCGMSPEVQARLFEPFFTTKEVSQGTGLGLSVVYGIVKGHDGFITVYSEEGRGSTFHVYLPAIESAVEEREVEGLEWPVGTETILLVDDEEMVLALGQRVLEPCGYTVLMAEDGVQALEVYRAHQGEIGLVVLDVIMPRMGGQECLRRLRELDPQVRVLISTGYTARGLAQELVAEGALGVVEKPFRIRDFAIAVRAALDES
jgi:two-component system cell cycle sensor histidine kinase/response regulator CckA